jgi:hypothetical protein
MEEYQQPMNIFIIGDSWGVPNYNSEFTNCHFTHHTEYQLQQLGHKVFNFSLNGSCMVETIEYARSFVDPNFNNDSMKYTIQHKRATYDRSIEGLKNVPVPDYKGERIDWLVWFHTEAMRGILQEDRIEWVMLEELHDMGAHMSYRAFVNLLKFLPNVKTAVIGGQAPVNKLLYEYHKPNFVIEDWRSEIVGRKLPRCISLSRLNMVERLYDSKEEKIKIMDVHNEIYDAMTNKELFFDMCHPGSKPHIELAKRLHEEFMKG